MIGASPPKRIRCAASQMKRRARAGAKLMRRSPGHRLVKSALSKPTPPRLMPGTNVAVINALAHVVVTEGLTKDE